MEANEELLAHTRQLIEGAFDLVVLMTGTGLAYWRDAALTRFPAASFRDALGRTALVARGPKPVAVLHGMGLKPAVAVPEPSTWREVVPILAARPERRIAIQEYGRGNPEFVAALEALGARVTAVGTYKWALPADTGPLKEAAGRIARAECDVVIFTSSVQLTHLLEIAGQEGLEAGVRDALARRVAVASVGPVMNAALEAEGLTPDIVPAHPKMGILVRAAAQEASTVLRRKGPRCPSRC